MLGDEEGKQLLLRAHEGDPAAKELLIEHNINLVRSIVHRFTGRGYEWDDLFQIGCIGLIKAIDRFDTNFSVKFSTYAVPMIIGEIRRFIRDDSPVKVSRPLKELAYRVHRAQEKLQGILGREPTIGEVAGELALPPQDIALALEAVQPPASLYDQTYFEDGDAVPRLDQIGCTAGPEGADLDKLVLREILSRLPPRERLVIQLRFFADKTQTEIARQIGLSQVQVSRIEKQALRLIKQYLQTS
jgi:RNA polymerase sigma-70 factor, sigma-B/F/G subfamily